MILHHHSIWILSLFIPLWPYIYRKRGTKPHSLHLVLQLFLWGLFFFWVMPLWDQEIDVSQTPYEVFGQRRKFRRKKKIGHGFTKEDRYYVVKDILCETRCTWQRRSKMESVSDYQLLGGRDFPCREMLVWGAWLNSR